MENFLITCYAVISVAKRDGLSVQDQKIKRAMWLTVNKRLHEYLFETDPNYVTAIYKEAELATEHFDNSITNEGANRKYLHSPT